MRVELSRIEVVDFCDLTLAPRTEPPAKIQIECRQSQPQPATLSLGCVVLASEQTSVLVKLLSQLQETSPAHHGLGCGRVAVAFGGVK